MIKFYDHPLSGNCYKVKLLMAQSNVEFVTEIVDVFKGENKKDKFIGINPATKIPAIDDDGIIVWESNAILMYLCEKYSPYYCLMIYKAEQRHINGFFLIKRQ